MGGGSRVIGRHGKDKTRTLENHKGCGTRRKPGKSVPSTQVTGKPTYRALKLVVHENSRKIGGRFLHVKYEALG
jgi:hypothetical protein